MILADAVAVQTVVESAVKPVAETVLTSHSPAWYCTGEVSLRRARARFRGGRPAAAGKLIGVASMAISGMKVLGLSASY